MTLLQTVRYTANMPTAVAFSVGANTSLLVQGVINNAIPNLRNNEVIRVRILGTAVSAALTIVTQSASLVIATPSPKLFIDAPAFSGSALGQTNASVFQAESTFFAEDLQIGAAASLTLNLHLSNSAGVAGAGSLNNFVCEVVRELYDEPVQVRM